MERNKSMKNNGGMSNALKILRWNKNFTQAKAAQYVNVSTRIWSNLETGNMPSFKTLVKIATVFKISPISMILLAFNKISVISTKEGIIFSYNKIHIVCKQNEFTEQDYLCFRIMTGMS